MPVKTPNERSQAVALPGKMRRVFPGKALLPLLTGRAGSGLAPCGRSERRDSAGQLRARNCRWETV